MSERRKGLLLCIAAYGMWGFMPLYWRLLRELDPFEVLSHRVIWALVALTALLALLGRLRGLFKIAPRRLAALGGAAAIIGANWAVYLWAVRNGRVVEVALGYFITPLVTVLLGVFVLSERLRPQQWFAVSLAAFAVFLLSLNYGRLPWIALFLALTFSTYGLAKRSTGVRAVESLAVEATFLSGPALAYLVVRQSAGNGAIGHTRPTTLALLVFTGVLATVPFLCFAAAARRVRFTTLGLLQYLSPSVQFLIGVFVFREEMPPTRWAGFAFVWSALALFAHDFVRGARTGAAERTAAPRARTRRRSRTDRPLRQEDEAPKAPTRAGA